MAWSVHNKNTLLISLLIVGVLIGTPQGTAEIRFPSIIGNHMVIQQEKPVRIWGWAIPGEEISVSFAGKAAQALADDNGGWEVLFPEMKADKTSLSMVISGSQSCEIVFEDILLGEVWVCSGQSNMEWSLSRTHSPKPDILRADHPGIRLFHIPRTISTCPLDDVETPAAENMRTTWEICDPDSIRNFSAVGYYFGREIHDKLDVPVGLIDSTWGGTCIEAWIPPSGFRAVTSLNGILDDKRKAEAEYRQDVRESLPKIEDWVRSSEDALSKGSHIPKLPRLPVHPHHTPQSPSSLYNGMIHPLIRLAVRGSIWYQGESNRNDGLFYEDMMSGLIQGWRQVWDQPDLAFYYVQLAPFNYGYTYRNYTSTVPDLYRLPLIWEAQRRVLSLPNTGMAVITDIANLNDIHPRNKKEVGYRLSLWALAKTYGRHGLVHSGPLFRSMSVEGPKIRIHFDHIGSGLISLDQEELSWFEIAGQDRIFHKATAEIDGDSVLVWCRDVPSPVAVRLGWSQLAGPNLGNKEGLPASPFRTDDWSH